MKTLPVSKSSQEIASDRAELAVITYLERKIQQGNYTLSDRYGRVNGFDTDGFLIRQEDSGFIRAIFDRNDILANGSLALYDAATTAKLLLNPFGSDRMQSRLQALMREHFDIELAQQTASVSGLTVRPVLASDADAAFQFLQFEKEAVWETGFNSLPKNEADTLRWLHNGSMTQTGAFDEVGNMMGMCGVMPNFKGIPNEQSISLFYMVAPPDRGKGVATTLAVEAMKGHQDCHPAFTHVVIHAKESNLASLNVAKHLGLARAEHTDYVATHFGKRAELHGHSAHIDHAIGNYLVKKMMREMPPASLQLIQSAPAALANPAPQKKSASMGM